VVVQLDGVPVGCGGFRAVARGYTGIRLEAGTNQPDAMALDASSGYRPMAPYGHYRESSLSRCFEKDLRP
jgi:hypothetical protein